MGCDDKGRGMQVSLSQCISSSEQAPQAGHAGQEHPQKDDNQGNLQPDKAADFPKDELDPWSPGSRYIIADGFHTVLYGALKSRQQFGLLVKCGRDTYPGQQHSKNSERVNFGVVPQS